ncbi:RES domain-containing protein [Microbacterium radiodurans]|uniref:RES domain-containing protein n=1 Tax=Microbacterium radiodurans TaxID=661398 RepID=A0A5J5IV84_9MICO|nr:RES domain-containing protein [Microbacterium radiodurans]KAA9089589.1 RES domain-containing protein [Microbacterium radiodurans]
MAALELQLADAAGVTVWRVGRAPDPWAWIDHQYAGKARWDDPAVTFRTIYAADSLFGCYTELLAYARPDRNDDGSDLLASIDEDPKDAADFPVPPAGSIERHWVTGRMVGTASLDGTYVDVRAAATVAALRPRYLTYARTLGFDDFDAAALKRAHPRELTHRLTVDFYAMTRSDGTPTLDGVHFGSRHGDDLALWAIYERPGDDPSSHRFRQQDAHLVREDDDELLRAMRLHGLTWRH